jgi:hypothetical protein
MSPQVGGATTRMAGNGSVRKFNSIAAKNAEKSANLAVPWRANLTKPFKKLIGAHDNFRAQTV